MSLLLRKHINSTQASLFATQVTEQQSLQEIGSVQNSIVSIMGSHDGSSSLQAEQASCEPKALPVAMDYALKHKLVEKRRQLQQRARRAR